jgi:hypothetical protein
VKSPTDYQQPDALPSRRLIFCALLLAAVTLGVYARTWNFQLLYWDDDIHVLQNPLVLSPNLAGVKQIFTKFFSTDYYPLTYASLALDHFIWRGEFFGYHVTQTILHALNVFLVALLLWKWTQNFGVSMLAAAFFAIHPVQVETVAWIAERKNALGTFFFLLAWLYFLRAEGKSKSLEVRWRLASLVFFVLAVLSHALVIVFPALLFAHEMCARGEKFAEAARKTWLFFVPAAFAAIMRVLGHAESAQLAPPFPNAISGMLTMTKVLGEYLNSLFWPLNLSNHYTVRAAKSVADGGFLCGILWIFVWIFLIWRAKLLRKWSGFALAWFLIALLPVLQLVPHPTLRADRYLYIAALGIFMLVAMILQKNRAIFATIGPISVICLLGLTLARIPVWQNPKTLWSDCVAKNPRDIVGHYSLGGVFIGEGNFAAGETHLRTALEIGPNFAEAHARLGALLLVQGRHDEARAHLIRALKWKPNLPEAERYLSALEQHTP